MAASIARFGPDANPARTTKPRRFRGFGGWSRGYPQPVDRSRGRGFAHPVERELAEALDSHGIPWVYEPRTFVLERDAEGRPTEAITPDFYLPEQDVWVECTVQRPSLARTKRRKVRKLRERFGVTIALFEQRDFERFAERYGLAFSTTTPSQGSSASPPATRSPARLPALDTATVPVASGSTT
jgi:hypoxanthine phosphoribosyltransferase